LNWSLEFINEGDSNRINFNKSNREGMEKRKLTTRSAVRHSQSLSRVAVNDRVLHIGTPWTKDGCQLRRYRRRWKQRHTAKRILERKRHSKAGRLLVSAGDNCRTNSSAFPDVRIRDWTID
jgi:hypothetical protein